MSTPTDPYSSNSRRPFQDDEILAPLTPEELLASRYERFRSLGRFHAA